MWIGFFSVWLYCVPVLNSRLTFHLFVLSPNLITGSHLARLLPYSASLLSFVFRTHSPTICQSFTHPSLKYPVRSLSVCISIHITSTRYILFTSQPYFVSHNGCSSWVHVDHSISSSPTTDTYSVAAKIDRHEQYYSFESKIVKQSFKDQNWEPHEAQWNNTQTISGIGHKVGQCQQRLLPFGRGAKQEVPTCPRTIH